MHKTTPFSFEIQFFCYNHLRSKSKKCKFAFMWKLKRLNSFKIIYKTTRLNFCSISDGKHQPATANGPTTTTRKPPGAGAIRQTHIRLPLYRRLNQVNNKFLNLYYSYFDTFTKFNNNPILKAISGTVFALIFIKCNLLFPANWIFKLIPRTCAFWCDGEVFQELPNIILTVSQTLKLIEAGVVGFDDFSKMHIL